MTQKTCLECGVTFKTESKYIDRGHGKFCSTSCAAKYGNKKRKKPPNTKCALCNKPLNRIPSRLKKHKLHYCNRECKKKAEYKGNNGGRNDRKQKGQQRRLSLAQKDKLLKTNGIKCMFPNCANDLFDDRSLIDLHHFDGPFNHQKTVLLCPYHHRLADKGYLIIKDGTITIA